MYFPKKFPRIPGPRIILADLSKVEVDEFMPIAMKGGKMVTDREKVAELIQTLGRDFGLEQTLCWGVFLESKLIGMFGFFRGFADQTGEVGYVLHADYRGKGYMNEAIILGLNYGWHELNLVKITAFTAADNAPSIKLLESTGFQCTGAEKDNYLGFVIHRPVLD
jgi:[ribosomal protein S5]-alanine N-acetyltransferase